ncbi:mevalonate kinase [Leucobacter massiliensis]|uniref:mevalonate kinase n=1 Tax=Leucobacter massiliensis TaxID=1686285 RepID=A0A2S9QPB1_9MICO|nr:mevalonate kinase [Leucobacter massiliensis]PRI11425.1 mevalonate kinase [Leucobacter massiliensis]
MNPSLPPRTGPGTAAPSAAAASAAASAAATATAAEAAHERGHGIGSAHAKAILFGEHAVVYGAPAIAVPLHQLEVETRIRSTPGHELRIESELFAGTASSAPERLRPVITAVRAALAAVGRPDDQVQLRVRSAIPHGRGLGSSAAVAAAVARAAADLTGAELGADAFHEIVQQAERVAHGNPSGIDARAVAAAGPIRFHEGRVCATGVGAPLTFVLADSGRPGSTAEAVAGVRERRAADPVAMDRALAQLSELAEGSVLDLELGDRPALGARMLQAHELLGRIGVSTVRLDALVDAARAAGAHGAKLTGGGLGGCVLALADSEQQAEHIALALRAAGARRTWTTTVAAS